MTEQLQATTRDLLAKIGEQEMIISMLSQDNARLRLELEKQSRKNNIKLVEAQSVGE